MNFITRYYREWSERKFLKKHGCETREQYDHKYDPDVFRRANRVKDFYHGYPYIYCFEDHNHEVYYWDLGIDGVYVVTQWCKKNLKGKYRFDFHRATRAPSTANDWEINELGGGDYIFFACRDTRDYTLFLLKWA